MVLLILTGKTASGKDTIIKKVLEKYPNFKKVLTATSRHPRKEEINGLDYNFISEAEFREKIDKGSFLEYVEYGGNFYGSEKSQINEAEDLIWKIDPSMAGKAKDVFPNSLVIYINCDNGTVLARLNARGLSKEEIEKRMLDDQAFWGLYQDKYDYVVENIPGDLESSLSQIYRIIDSKK